MHLQDSTLGVFTPFDSLDSTEQKLVVKTWAVAEKAYVPRSNFPVGAVVLAQNANGQTGVFEGCNVENRFFSPTICAERNAITTAVAYGFTKILKIALVCKNYQGPGSSPCGLCRQVIVEFGSQADILGLADTNHNVRKFVGAELLPAAQGAPIVLTSATSKEKRFAKKLRELLPTSYVPYSKKPQAAIFVATNGNGAPRHFPGVPDDNASYGGSAPAECVAMRTAKTKGYTRNVTLAVTVDDLNAVNPVEGESLQVLREFGKDATILLVDENALVRTSIVELLPDSFGPESLH